MPVLIFKQIRIGYMDNPFWIYKFKTMDDNGNVTKIGALLRKTGLDELPQIINVLKGEMVLVGPRPLTPQDHQKFRNFPLPVKPGFTGWWQIHGRVQQDIRRLDFDYFFMKNKSWWFGLCVDLYIIWKTIPLVVLAKHG